MTNYSQLSAKPYRYLDGVYTISGLHVDPRQIREAFAFLDEIKEDLEVTRSKKKKDIVLALMVMLDDIQRVCGDIPTYTKDLNCKICGTKFTVPARSQRTLCNNCKSHSKWTKNEDSKLKKMYQMNIPVSEIAVELGRPEQGVERRIRAKKKFWDYHV